MVMGHNFVIAVVPEPMPFLEALHHQFKENPLMMQSHGRILYEFLDFSVHHYLDFIDFLEDKIDVMESLMHSTFPYTTEADNAYFMDLFDHINRISTPSTAFGTPSAAC